MSAVTSCENVTSGAFRVFFFFKLRERKLFFCPQEIRAQVFVSSTEVGTHTGTRADSTGDAVTSSYCCKFGLMPVTPAGVT